MIKAVFAHNLSRKHFNLNVKRLNTLVENILNLMIIKRSVDKFDHRGTLYARYLCSRDALGLKAKRARDDRVSCIQRGTVHDHRFNTIGHNRKPTITGF